MTALRRIVRRLRLADRQAETLHGLSAAQLFVLHSLAAAPVRSLADLAQRTLTDQSSVSTVVTRLVERGLVARTPAAADRRRAELALTAAGARVVQGSSHLPQPRIIEAVRGMPASRRREVVRALEALSTAIGADLIAPRMLFEDEHTRRRER